MQSLDIHNFLSGFTSRSVALIDAGLFPFAECTWLDSFTQRKLYSASNSAGMNLNQTLPLHFHSRAVLYFITKKIFSFRINILLIFLQGSQTDSTDNVKVVRADLLFRRRVADHSVETCECRQAMIIRRVFFAKLQIFEFLSKLFFTKPYVPDPCSKRISCRLCWSCTCRRNRMWCLDRGVWRGGGAKPLPLYLLATPKPRPFSLFSLRISRSQGALAPPIHALATHKTPSFWFFFKFKKLTFLRLNTFKK